MEKVNFLVGLKSVLNPIELKNVPEIVSLMQKWTNDPVVTYYMFTGQRPKNKEKVALTLKKDLESENNVIFLVQDKKTGKLIGYAGLYDINMTVRKAEYRVLIGQKEFWGKGYGTEVTELITFFGFDRLNLNRIYLGYTKDNKAAGKTYEKAGYVYEGTRKEDLYRNSNYYDSVIMAILRKDYYKKIYQSYLKKYGQKI